MLYITKYQQHVTRSCELTIQCQIQYYSNAIQIKIFDENNNALLQISKYI